MLPVLSLSNNCYYEFHYLRIEGVKDFIDRYIIYVNGAQIFFVTTVHSSKQSIHYKHVIHSTEIIPIIEGSL